MTDLEAEFRAVYSELFPRGPQLTVSKAEIAMLALMERKIEQAKKTTVVAPAYAEGARQERFDIKYILEEQ